MKTNKIAAGILTLSIVSAMAVPTFAAADAGAYSFNAGKTNGASHQAQYAALAEDEDDTAYIEFYAENDVAGGEQGDTSAYSYLAGKEGRDTTNDVPYAGKNYEGGEQGDTSAYSYLKGRTNAASYTGEDRDTSAYGFNTGKVNGSSHTQEGHVDYAGSRYEGGEQGDTSAYGYLAGKANR